MVSKTNKNKATSVVMATILVTSFFSFMTMPPADAPHAFSPTINLSNNSGTSKTPQIAVSGNNVYVVWVDNTLGNPDIFFSRSVDNGVTFSTSINLSNTVSESREPQIAVSGNNVYVVWMDNIFGWEILFRRSTDNGATFGPTLNLTNNTRSFFPQIAVSGNNVYVVWQDDALAPPDIFFARSTDNGANFSNAVNISNTPVNSEEPQVAASGSNVYVVWKDIVQGNRDIFFARSTDNGVTFSNAVNMSNTPVHSTDQEIAASGSNVYVAWSDSENADIFFARSTDNGATFGPTLNLSNNTAGSLFPQIAVSGNNVYVVWWDSTISTTQSLFNRSTDNGATFGTPTIITDGGGPQIAVSGSNVYVVSESPFPSSAILFNKSTDNGATFGTQINLGGGSVPQIAASGSDVYVVWEGGSGLNTEILFRRSINNPPVANAGPDQTVRKGTLVTLNGASSSDPDGDTLSFSWTQVAGPTVTLSNPNTANPTFTAPLVDFDTVLAFQLVVNDGALNSSPDTVNTIVKVGFYSKGSFVKSTATAPTSQSITGVGFQPKAVIFFYTKQTAEGFAANERLGIGFATSSTNERAVAIASDDAFASSNAGRRMSESNAIITLSNGNPTLAAQAELTSFDVDGFTIRWTTNDVSADIIHYIALGGSLVTNAKAGTFSLATGTGNQAVTGVGFQPDFVMFLWSFTGAMDANIADSEIGIGFAKSSTERAAIVINSEDGRTTMDTWQQQRTNAAILLLKPSSGAQDAIVDFVSMNADGFTVNKSDAPAGSTPIFYLALKGGEYKVGSFNQQTSVGNQQVTGVGFKPASLILASFNKAAATAIQSNARISLGAAADFSGSEGSIWGDDIDALPDSEVNVSTLTTRIIRMAAGPSTINAEADLSSFDNDGFTLNWTVADTVARQIIYVAFKDADSDNDGLYDSWETKGIDYNRDGTIDLDLRALGASPSHKDIFVEIDYMETNSTDSHKPNQTAINNVVAAFANVSNSLFAVPNPDGMNGINLHILDEQIAHQDTISIPDGTLGGDFLTLKNTYFGTLAERQSSNAQNILQAKKLVYHYNLWIHDQLERVGTSGIAELPGNDFVVSLGSFTVVNGHGVGSVAEQEGTFMHELGHNLNLRHGGNVNENCKPNYLSVMSYSFQMPYYVPNRPLDYSRSTLAPLNENSLNEPDGVGASTPPGLTTVYGPPPRNTTVTGVAVDWNRNGNSMDTGVVQNINNIGIRDCNFATFTILNGYNDWASLQLPFTSDPNFADGVYTSVVDQEITIEIVRQIRHSNIVSLDYLIQNLPNVVFDNPALADDRKNVLHKKLMVDSDSAAEFVKIDNLKNVIAKLYEIRLKADGADGGNKKDDWVVDSDAQIKILEELDRIIATFQKGLP